jgi:polysaccharide export outer membrane protein
MKKSAAIINISVVAICFWILCSCGNVRELQYMQGQFDTTLLSQANYPEPLIQKNDLLSITVYSDDPRASAYYNLPALPTVSSTGSILSSSSMSGGGNATNYLVDQSGNIQMPGIGPLPVAGLTKNELYKLLQEKVKDKLQNAYFIIRLNSYTITMIGEVTRPGQFTIPNERVSLLEAIALAGDLTVYGRRDNVLIIREINGKRSWGRIDLKNPEILNSPYFYLQPNDVVYVDLNKTKSAANDQIVVRNITLAISIVSVAAVIISITKN